MPVPANRPGERCVYVTRGGTRYHEDAGCPALVDGQDKARDHGYAALPVHEVALWDAIVHDRVPCAYCVSSSPVHSPEWRRAIKTAARRCETTWERRFLIDALPSVDSLDPSRIEAQRALTLPTAGDRRIDFAIEVGHAKIAIEISGQDKTGSGLTEGQHNGEALKYSDLAAEGWRVLHFTNRQVSEAPRTLAGIVERALPSHADEGVHNAVSAGSPTRPNADQEAVAPSRRRARPRRRRALIAAGGLAAAASVVGVALAVSAPTQSGGASPATASCPATAPLKGNINDEGERIYHSPGQQYYERTNPEECFATAEEAEAAGYRASKV